MLAGRIGTVHTQQRATARLLRDVYTNWVARECARAECAEVYRGVAQRVLFCVSRHNLP